MNIPKMGIPEVKLEAKKKLSENKAVILLGATTLAALGVTTYALYVANKQTTAFTLGTGMNMAFQWVDKHFPDIHAYEMYVQEANMGPIPNLLKP